MSYSEANKRATMKYIAKAYERIELKVKMGNKDAIKAYAESKGMSLNAYINALIERDMDSNPETQP